jgi:hypothetical protein
MKQHESWMAIPLLHFCGSSPPGPKDAPKSTGWRGSIQAQQPRPNRRKELKATRCPSATHTGYHREVMSSRRKLDVSYQGEWQADLGSRDEPKGTAGRGSIKSRLGSRCRESCDDHLSRPISTSTE